MTKYFLSAVLMLTTVSAIAQTSVSKKNGKIVLQNGSTQTVVTDSKDAGTPYLYNNKVYYLQKSAVNGNTKITSYDVVSNQNTDVIRIGMKSDDGYTVKSDITNMILNANKGLIYFTTLDTYNGTPYSLTWLYNINDGKYKVFSDGKLDNIDYENNVTVVFEGIDPKGHYTQMAHYTIDHDLIKMDDRLYK